MHVLPIAAPSCVLPSNVAENAKFLAEKVQEVGLCFFEAKGTLAYTDADLPPSLAKLPLTWHVHLPVDLPWYNAHEAAKLALKVIQKANFLKIRFAVLHPPTGESINKAKQEQLLFDFAKTWYAESKTQLLLENINGAPIVDLDPKLFEPHSAHASKFFGICLDLGHMLGFGQVDAILKSNMLKHVCLVHWSAPGKLDEHLPLTYLLPHEYTIAQEVIKQIPQNTCHMLEIFNWSGLEKSHPVLAKLLETHHG